MRRILATAILSLTILACTPSAAANATPAPTATPTATCDRACWEAIVARQKAERIWWAEVVRQQQARAAWARLAAHVEAQRRAEAARRTGGAYVQGIEVCNGRTLPTCGIVRRESGFNPHARNPRSTAWGLYQFLRGTWRGVCPEYPHGAASVAQQVECARRLWNGGRGAGHWRLTT